MISRVNYEVPEISFEITKDNADEFFVADIHGGRSFLLNDGGYPMNDVDVIIRQQDESIRQSMLSQLQEVATSGVPADTPNAEILLSLKSRYQQTPSEMVRFYERQLELSEMRQSESKPAENKISFEDNENQSVNNV